MTDRCENLRRPSWRDPGQFWTFLNVGVSDTFFFSHTPFCPAGSLSHTHLKKGATVYTQQEVSHCELPYLIFLYFFLFRPNYYHYHRSPLSLRTATPPKKSAKKVAKKLSFLLFFFVPPYFKRDGIDKGPAAAQHVETKRRRKKWGS